MKHLSTLMLIALGHCMTHAEQSVVAKAGKPEILSVQKIAADAPHSGFTDLTRFKNLFYCCFRESSSATGGEGQVRLMLSFNGATWKNAATLKQEGVDLRDPKLSLTADGRLICFMTGVEYDSMKPSKRQPRVTTSTDGSHWAPVEKTLKEGDYLWRAVAHPTEKCFYGTVYQTAPIAGGVADEAEWTLKLMKSDDGKVWQLVTPFDIKGKPNEATARPLASGDMMALVRRDAPGSNKGLIGSSKPPYRQWTWTPLTVPLAGQDFVELPGGRLISGSRGFGATPGAHMILSDMTPAGLTPLLELPSSGDCSYPGLYYHEGTLLVSYYSSHEGGKAAIYIAKIQL
jgi:hypothetical protein